MLTKVNRGHQDFSQRLLPGPRIKVRVERGRAFSDPLDMQCAEALYGSAVCPRAVLRCHAPFGVRHDFMREMKQKMLVGVALSICVLAGGAVADGPGDILFGGGLLGVATRHHKNADSDAAVAKYKDKFVVVMDEGLSVGSRPAGTPCFVNVIDSRLVPEGRLVGDLPGETPCAVDPLRKGEVLKVVYVRFYRGYLSLNLHNLSPHSVTRGLGAFCASKR